ncbi:MAG: spermidine/putrescine ABC transporter ATP-binding protein [Candidatus Improbicoccus pseudotrichonymphae]|uniref:Spermidine/putrescine ABC transporter ATP-binding protein n=1 Tax=Candidatus Improbicoccus pseudotrichonymphae TaxID=3033792 RepID=A0AA48L0X1_9FIRM|nr:MAG: spermidine/putrescine ABC transporter ATP-binding protein [Candidatus Improbicoccus pseudotrichonymphae]
MHSTILEFRNVNAFYGRERVLDTINLYVSRGKFLTFLGPSGCGKTTVLRIINGFHRDYTGDVKFEGKKINNLPAHKREINTIFQKYALFTHLNVYDNIAFGLRIKREREEKIQEQVSELLDMVNLSSFAKRDIETLSGGQQQRVAIARALALKPKLLLLDEPFAALDLKLRKDMQRELKKLQLRTEITFIFVTHDQEEALSMSDTVVVMNKGAIQQIGTPEDIYNEPQNAFVADFIGESNIIDGVMISDFNVKFAGMMFKCIDFGFMPNEAVDVVIRPEDIKIVNLDLGDISGKIISTTFKGVYNEIIVDVNNFKWMIQTTEYYSPGEEIGLNLVPDSIHIMKKSEYSDQVGDYSSFSDEYEETNIFDFKS